MDGPEADRELIRRCFVFTAVPGSGARHLHGNAAPGQPDRPGRVRWVVSRVIRPGDPLRRAYKSVIANNPPGVLPRTVPCGDSQQCRSTDVEELAPDGSVRSACQSAGGLPFDHRRPG